MKDLFKVKHGGFSGLKQKRVVNIRKMSLALFTFIAVLFTVSICNAEVETLKDSVASTGMALAFAAPAFIVEGKFKELSAEEIEKLTEKEAYDYYVEKFKHERAELENRIKALEKEKEGDKYKSLEEEVRKLKDDNYETLKTALKEQGLVLESLKNNKRNANTLASLEESIKASIEANIEKFKANKDGKREEFQFEIKAAGNMTLAGNVSGGNVPQAQRLPEINAIQERQVGTYPLIRKLTTDRNVVEWIYETAQDGTPASVAEGAAKPQIDNDFVVTSVSLGKYAAHMKVSTEMMDDAPFMVTFLRNKLMIRLFLIVDSTMLTQLQAVATTFAAGTFAGTVDNANNIDSLTVAINQIKLANFNPTNIAIKMHPSDVTALKLVKLSATDKRYVDRLVDAAGSLRLDGYPIIEDTGIAVGNFLVGDFGLPIIVEKGSIMVDVGLDGNDFTLNLRTMLAEWRGVLLFENNNRTGMVKGVFATTNAALETP